MTAFAYDANDNLTSVVDPLSRTTSYAYDKLNRVTLATEAVGTGVQRTSATAYDVAGQVTSVTNARGYATRFAYDAAGRMTAVTDARTKVTAYAHDAAGNVTAVTDPLTHTTAFGYDALDRLTKVTDPLTRVTTAAYDKNGNVTSVTDPRTNTTAYGHDRLNRTTSLTNPLTQTTALAYDASDNLTRVTNPRTAVTTYAYDKLNRVTSATDPVSSTTSFAYNSAGDLSKVTDPAGKATSYGYDALGRLVTVTAPTSGVTTYAYDAGDRVTSVTDPLTHATLYGYDALDRVTVATDALSFATKMGYDANDNVTRVQDAATNVTTFAYDALDRRTSETDPLTKTITYAYDDGSRLTAVTDRLGRAREFGYDAVDRRTTEVWKAAGGSVVQTQTFGYDAAGNLTSATDPDGNYTIAYDAADRATAVTEPYGVSLAFGYDAAGNRTSVTDSGGATQTSLYDLADRLTSRRLDTASGDVRADYGYTSRGQVSSVTRYSDLAGATKVGSSSYGYDDGTRVTAITHANATGTTLASFGYAYDLADRVTSVTENGTPVAYGYDNTDQVTSNNGAAVTYDGAGNRTTAGYTTTAGNRLGSDGTWSYTYNDEGQVTGKSKSGTSWTYAYDHAGQLVSATDGTSTVAYAYDAFGNRVQRTEGTGVTRYAYDGWDTAKPMAAGSENFDAWADLNGSSTITTRRVYGTGFDDATVRVSSGGTVGWYGADRLGSVRKVIDNSGSVVTSSDFDAFGNLTAGSLSDRYGFTGREWDATVSVYDYRARVYSPTAGRFLSEDPMGLGAGDPNLHRYVGNGATNGTDASGMMLGSVEAPAIDVNALGEAPPGGSNSGSNGSTSDAINDFVKGAIYAIPDWLTGRDTEQDVQRGIDRTADAAADVYLKHIKPVVAPILDSMDEMEQEAEEERKRRTMPVAQEVNGAIREIASEARRAGAEAGPAAPPSAVEDANRAFWEGVAGAVGDTFRRAGVEIPDRPLTDEETQEGILFALDALHLFLDVIGLFPVIDTPADIANGGLYELEGNHVEAGLSGASIALPGIMGSLPAFGRWWRKGSTLREAAAAAKAKKAAATATQPPAALRTGSMVRPGDPPVVLTPMAGKTPVAGGRQAAIDRAWAQEVELVKRTGKGTAPWTDAEIARIKAGDSYGDLGYTGHHINKVSDHKVWEGDPRNIAFLKQGSGESHMTLGHPGGTRAPQPEGYLIDRDAMLNALPPVP